MILVSGGSGLVGSHLLYRLVENGHNIRAIYRSEKRLAHVKDVFALYTSDPDTIFNKVDWFEADINDIPRLTEAFEGITQVYHSAAYISFDPAHFNTLKKINIEGTANIVNLAIAKKVSKLCYVSSIAALGETTDDELITERTYWNSEADNSVYAISKYGAEMEVWRGTQEGLDAVIVNPSVIIGTGARGSGSGSIVRMAAKGSKYYTPGGISIVDVRDVVSAMYSLMESDVKNEQFILSGSNMLLKEFFEKTATVFNVSPPSKSISKSKLKILRLADWFSSKVFGSRRRLFRTTINSIYTVNYYDGSKIEDHIAFQYTPVADTLSWAAENFRKKTTG